MSKKGSLLSGSGFDSIGKKSGGGGSGKKLNSNDKVKIGIAAGLLVVAGLLLAWHLGAVDTTPTVEPPPPEVLEEIKERERFIEIEVEQGRMEAPAGM